MAVRSYRDLDAWRVSMQLAEGCYRFTDGFPRHELFGLAAHIRKTAVSIPSNVAEGHSRKTRPAFLNALAIAMGSQAELETQIELARRLRFGAPDVAERLLADAAEVGRILFGLWTAVGRPHASSPTKQR